MAFLGREIKKMPITYVIVHRGNEILTTFFTATDRNPVLRVTIRGAEDIAMVKTTCLGEKPVCKEIERFLQAITKLQHVDMKSKTQLVHRFSISNKY